MPDLTSQRKSVAKAPALAGVKVSGQGTTAFLREEFRSFWANILIGESVAPLYDTDRLRPGDNLSPTDRAGMSPTDFERGDALISHVDFLSIVMRTPRGKAGGSDGVLGEYLMVMSADQLGALLVLLTATLQGSLPMPPSWTRADVTLIPKVAGALLAKQYRPITVLPDLQKLALRVWLHASMPHLELRQKGSHGFRPSLQAAELQAIVRLLFEKRRAWGLPAFLAKLDTAKAYDTFPGKL